MSKVVIAKGKKITKSFYMKAKSIEILERLSEEENRNPSNMLEQVIVHYANCSNTKG